MPLISYKESIGMTLCVVQLDGNPINWHNVQELEKTELFFDCLQRSGRYIGLVTATHRARGYRIL